MTESATPRSHRREHAHAKADALLDDLFEDLESGLRTTPLPRYRIYPEIRQEWGWGKWLAGAGVVAVLLAGWGTWRSYSRLVTQVVQPPPLPTVTIPEPDPVVEQAAQTPEKPEPQPEKQPIAQPAQPVVAAAPARVAQTRPVSRPVAYMPPEPEVIRYVAPPPQRLQTSLNQPLPMKLVGTVSGPGTPMALILIDDVVREVPVGQTVLGAWRVQSVSRDGVLLSDGRQGVAMHLGLGQGH